MPSPSPVNVVILGAGFGGIAAARRLAELGCASPECRVTVVDRSRVHVFTPLLYEAATGFIEHENVGSAKLMRTGISVDNAYMLSRWGADFVEDEVVGVDWDAKKVLLGSGAPLEFDHLIVALGAETNFYGIDGMQERALTLKSLKDADRLRQKVHDVMHKCEKGTERKIDIVIGGGGATGVELAAELTMFLRRHLVKGHLRPEDFQISLVEATPRILGMLPQDLSAYAAERLRNLGVKLYLDTCVKRLERGEAVIAPRPLRPGEKVEQLVCDFRGEMEKRVDADILVWTGGIRGSSTLERLGLKLDDRGKRVEVGPNLEVPGRPGAFAIGDSALLIDPKTKMPVPWLAQAAMVMGKCAAGTIANRMKGAPDVQYHFPAYPTIIPLGGKYAVAKVGKVVLKGVWGWLLKEAANLRYFLSILPPHSALKLWWRGTVLYTRND